MKNSRELIKLRFKAGSVFEDAREIPKYVKIVCSNCHISGPSKSIRKDYNVQPHLFEK